MIKTIVLTELLFSYLLLLLSFVFYFINFRTIQQMKNAPESSLKQKGGTQKVGSSVLRSPPARNKQKWLCFRPCPPSPSSEGKKILNLGITIPLC